MTFGQPFRSNAGGRIKRDRPVKFSFNGRIYEGYEGDTLASALLANGVRIVGRSFKFHRPRGIMSAGVEEPNALVGADYGAGTIPLVRATLLELTHGLKAESQNGFPSVHFDLGRAADLTRGLWPAGFYNKMFKWPSWEAYEGVIRRMAGRGRLPGGEDPVQYRHRNVHCDLLVVGTGPAGLKAGIEAARCGKDVLLVEQDFETGGSLLHDPMVIDECDSDDWLTATVAELQAYDNVRLLLRSTLAGYYDHNVLTIHERAAIRGGAFTETFWKVRAESVILATGAIEQPLLFGNNDLPGVMLAGAMHHYAGRYGVHCGRHVVGAVNNDQGWRSLLSLAESGLEVVAIVDSRRAVRDELREAAEHHGIAVHVGAVPLRACGWSAVRALEFSTAASGVAKVKCDAIAMAGGLNPTVHLYSQAGGKLRYDASRACFVPAGCRQAVTVVGAANGDFASPEEYSIARRDCAPGRTGSQWVDFQHDVTVSDLELAVRENYVAVEHLKRYTTAGMAVDQGKTSNLNVLTLLAKLTDRLPGDVGTTTFRPNFMPVTLGAIAGNRQGELYAPTRHLPANDWHADHGAVFDNYGVWKRPAYYGEDRDSSIAREVRMVRAGAGLFDASPLGKIEVKGPDAAEFLNRIYVNTVPTIRPNQVRYGLMLDENGVVMDDGVFMRLAEDHFLLNTTAANADRVVAWLEEWHQCEWPWMELLITPVTTQWAVMTVAGPNARQVLQSLPGMMDLDNANVHHMSCQAGEFANNVPYRIHRVSFSGELSYELNVPASCATEYLDHLYHAGTPYGLGLFGIEALLVLRMEKGFLHVGVDTDGTTNLADIGFSRMAARKQTDFIGARSLARSGDRCSDRRQLVGFLREPDAGDIRAGAHFVTDNDGMRRSEGFVTSACRSPTLDRPLGLGLLERGFEREGEVVKVFDDGVTSHVQIVAPCFYDPKGARMRG